jgi:aminoglycoside phosphotransferase (APT) family kinase protein
VVTEPGELIAQGRDADIFEFGPGLVLRRARDGRSIEPEARLMEHVRAAGIAVPQVHEVRAGGTEIVMDRIDGPTMVDVFTRQPWAMRRHTHVLAEFHRQIHELVAPEWMPQLSDGGDRIVHLDIHPLNVLYGPDGPVLIDWPNASRGRPETDLAQTWLIIAASDTSDLGLVERMASPLQRLVARLVIREFDRDAIVPFLRPVAEERSTDRNMRPGEIEAMFRIVKREERRVARVAPPT